MFGRQIRSSLGVPNNSDINYEQFEKNDLLKKSVVKEKW